MYCSAYLFLKHHIFKSLWGLLMMELLLKLKGKWPSGVLVGAEGFKRGIVRHHPNGIWKRASKVLVFLKGRKRPSPEGSTSKSTLKLRSDGCSDSAQVCMGRDHHGLRNSSQHSAEAHVCPSLCLLPVSKAWGRYSWVQIVYLALGTQVYNESFDKQQYGLANRDDGQMDEKMACSEIACS